MGKKKIAVIAVLSGLAVLNTLAGLIAWQHTTALELFPEEIWEERHELLFHRSFGSDAVVMEASGEELQTVFPALSFGACRIRAGDSLAIHPSSCTFPQNRGNTGFLLGRMDIYCPDSVTRFVRSGLPGTGMTAACSGRWMKCCVLPRESKILEITGRRFFSWFFVPLCELLTKTRLGVIIFM